VSGLFKKEDFQQTYTPASGMLSQPPYLVHSLQSRGQNDLEATLGLTNFI